MNLLKSLAISLVVVVSLVFGSAYAGSESDDNTSGISALSSENSVYIHWNRLENMRFYEFTIEDVYGSYYQRFTTFDNYKSIGLTDQGVYKVTLEGYDGTSSFEFSMGYYYFAFGYGESSIDPVVLADLIVDKMDIEKEIKAKVYTFRTIWNDGWQSAFSLSNTSAQQQDVNMKVINTTTNSLLIATITVQPNDIFSKSAKDLLSLVNITDDIYTTNFIVTFEVPTVVDVENYLWRIEDGIISGVTKDTVIDSYIYEE